jgi:glucose-1-phosphate adenylyltransferase
MPRFNFYDKEWPIRTYQPQYPPADFVFAQEDRRMGIALGSAVSGWCVISGGRVTNSVLSPGRHIQMILNPPTPVLTITSTRILLSSYFSLT